MNRRQFLSASAGAAGLVVLSGCGDGTISGPFTELPTDLSVTVASLPGLATVGNLVQIPGQPVAVKRTGAATFEAFSMICTHQGCTVGITGGSQFDCPCHASRFDVNGQVLRGPAGKPLPKLVTAYDAATDTLTIS